MLRFSVAIICGALPFVAAQLSVGVGVADITGAPAQVGMMGYAKEGQNTAGLHFRQYARAVAMLNTHTNERVCIVSADIAMIFATVKNDVLARLNADSAPTHGLYTGDNLVLSAIHNHGGPGGFAKLTLYSITTLGYNNETAEAIVAGIVEAVTAATQDLAANHASQSHARLALAASWLYNTSANRSPTSYLEDPASERAEYPDGNTDKTFQVLRIDTTNATDTATTRPTALMAWFAVHCTSMPNSNLLITGDNKGVASMLTERAVNGAGSAIGGGPFVASFLSGNLGDVSPNTRGAFCPDGRPCDAVHSTCGGRNEGCQGQGPAGTDWVQSTHMIGSQQADAALNMWRRMQPAKSGALEADGARARAGRGLSAALDSATLSSFAEMSSAGQMPPGRVERMQAAGPAHAASGVVDTNHNSDGDGTVELDGAMTVRHVWVEMNNGTVPARFTHNGADGVTCPAALGTGFAAGTTDGPGMFNFVQGNQTVNPFWHLVRGAIRQPTPFQVSCQAPKSVLLDVGEMPEAGSGPARLLGKYWVAHRLPFQMVRLSADPPVLMCAIPGEMTTMSGRRLRRAVATAYTDAHNTRFMSAAAVADLRPARPLRASEVTVLVTGLSNEYSHYVATPDEYMAQRYEAASTLYGIHTLGRHLFAFSSLAAAIARGDYSYPAGLDAGGPPEFPPTPPSFIPPVLFDEPPLGKAFGDVHEQPSATVARGATVKAVFWGANPRTSRRPHPRYGYLVVERDAGSAGWVAAADDSAFETAMAWDEIQIIAASHITVTWTVPADATPGTYRITHFGVAKSITGKHEPYSGTTHTFEVTA
eukprot:TRINITY_DN350_c0_g1_i1.p1 TRINITY_DN350_c0_g1~~TRINITY_DN350_c0_g1_i1.p1  ORF type:complete len:821 (+),score=208.21 TRINITY_DN350_c0_g1_i1:172-2634(+)